MEPVSRTTLRSKTLLVGYIPFLSFVSSLKFFEECIDVFLDGRKSGGFCVSFCDFRIFKKGFVRNYTLFFYS